MYGASRTAYPSWYVEGFAEYFMTATFKPDKVTLGKANTNRASWLIYAKWLPTERVLARRFGPDDKDSLSKFYAQSWALTHYMFRTPGMESKFTSYLTDVAKGADPVEAFKANITPNIGHFEITLRRYLSSKKFTYTSIRRPAKTPASVNITTLSPAAGDLLLVMADLDKGYSPPENKDRATEIVTSLAARHPNTPEAARAQAVLALRYGDKADARIRLDALLTAAPKDDQLLRWRADASETPDESLDYLVRAFKINANDWWTLWHYALAKGARSHRISDNTLEVLARAAELAPQVSGLSIHYAIALVRSGRFDKAETVLAPVANNPHGGPMADFASALAERAAAKDEPGFLALLETGIPPEKDETSA